ncbi:MAG: ComF family protein [Phycisphaerae bacterium]|nr:ComF family protein [Phycisphaerae bacterium]
MPLGRLLRDLADFCYPPICEVCNNPAVRWPLCDPCLQGLERIESQPYCHRCAMPLSEQGAPCPYCRGCGLHPFGRVLRLCNFEDPIKPLLHRLKFRHDWALGEFLADRLFASGPVRSLLEQCDALVPVPLHPFRQITRGYNQSQIIARRLAKLSRQAVLKPAIRLKHTRPQTAAQSRSQRAANVRRAFGLLKPQLVEGRRIVVIDDVRTTAATLQAFGRCLLDAKPASLDAVVIAVSDWRHADFTRI